MLRPRLPSTELQDSKSAQRFRSVSIVFWPAGCPPSVTLHVPIQKSNCRYSSELQVGAATEGVAFASSAIAARFQKKAPAAASDRWHFGACSIFMSSTSAGYCQSPERSYLFQNDVLPSLCRMQRGLNQPPRADDREDAESARVAPSLAR